jgi:hypothetical protein
LGDGILDEAIDRRDGVERLRRSRRGFGRLDPGRLIGSSRGAARDFAFGRLVLVDEAHPEGRNRGEAHLAGVTALLRASQIAPVPLLESEALGQLALVFRDVARDVGRQAGFDHRAQTF